MAQTLHGKEINAKLDHMAMKEERREQFAAWGHRAEEHVANLPDIRNKMEQYIRSLQDQLAQLHMEKESIVHAKFTAQEVEKNAVERLREFREKQFVDGPILHHMRQIQSGLLHAWEPGGCGDMVSERDLWRIVLALVTEDDIKAACAKLPPGLSKEKRQAQIAEIDARIREVEAKLEKGIDKSALAQLFGIS